MDIHHLKQVQNQEYLKKLKIYNMDFRIKFKSVNNVKILFQVS